MNCKLFEGINENELPLLLKKLSATEIVCDKNTIVLHSGEKVKNIYVCIEGSFVLENINSDGSVNIISTLSKGSHFGRAFAFTDAISPADLRALSKGKLIAISKDRLLLLDDGDTEKNKIFANLISILANKSTFLITKIQHLSQRSIRGKITSYLNEISKQSGKREFLIPLDRQGLADYLCVDRSALSKELSKMRDDGLIDYRKNMFVIKY